MEVSEGGCYVEDNSGYKTPKRGGKYEIPAATECPKAPRKKGGGEYGKQKIIKEPKNGYFQSPELEQFFATAYIKQSTYVISHS